MDLIVLKVKIAKMREFKDLIWWEFNALIGNPDTFYDMVMVIGLQVIFIAVFSADNIRVWDELDLFVEMLGELC